MLCLVRTQWKCALLMGVLIAVLVAYLEMPPQPIQPNEIEYWGPKESSSEEPPKDDESIRPFTVVYNERTIAGLREELARVKWFEPVEGVNYRDGVNTKTFRDVMEYWRTKFDFEKAQDDINKYPHFKSEIEGLKIHFFRSIPTLTAANVEVIPLLLIHGWPGSFVEFLEAAAMLSAPVDGVAFDVVVPSIPGFGYSDAPRRRGVDIFVTARIFDKLMSRLGFTRYFVQGGDWGALIAQAMALTFPERVRGLHVNFLMGALTGLTSLVKQGLFFAMPTLLGDGPLPPCMVTSSIESAKLTFVDSTHIYVQATKPDTIGLALMNSAVGLAAHVMEKYSSGFNRTFRDFEDGGLGTEIDLDRVLANVMIYYDSNSIASSMRFYKENFESLNVLQVYRRPIFIPAGYAVFPNEHTCLPRFLVEGLLRNLTTMTYHEKGGHFVATELPVLFSYDVRSFIKTVLQRYPE